jgi:hypothetical protein
MVLKGKARTGSILGSIRLLSNMIASLVQVITA